MAKLSFILAAGAFLVAGSAALADDAAAPLTPGQQITLPGVGASFDYMMPDPALGRIYASHPGAKAFVSLSLRNMSPKLIDLGAEVNGVAVDSKDNKVFTGGGGQKVFVLDEKSLKTKDVINLDGPGDDIYYDADNGMLYVDNDDGTKIWVIDTATDKVASTVTIDTAPEYMAYDSGTKRLFQNIKSANEVQVIDTTTNAVTATWPTAPAKSPHGLVFDASVNRLYSAGKNDTLVVIDASSGAVVGNAKLASPVDQIALDPALHRIYCPGNGFMTVVSLAADGSVASTASMAIPATAHTVAVDPATHDVWICYFDKAASKSYLQQFKAVTAVSSAR